MKIRLTDIPPGGLVISDTIPLEALNARLRLGQDHGISFIEPPQVKVTVWANVGGAETKGTITSRYRQPCALCVEDLERDVQVQADFSFKQKTAKDLRTSVDEESEVDDIGLCWYDGDSIDLEDLVQESLILSLSPYFRPPTGQSGECLICAKNLSKELESITKPDQAKLSLGVLLKKAGV